MSVIIPTFNRRQLVREAVDSALRADAGDVEVVVVDDGSTDGTGAALAGADARVRYLRQERRGRSAARNLGTRASTGELLVFLDSDDLLLPAGLVARRDVLDADPGLDVAYGDGFYCDAAGVILERIGLRWPRFEPERMLETLVLQNVIAAPHLAMVRRRSLEALGDPVFDESLHGMEDADLWIRLAARGGRFARLDEPVGLYRLHEGNASSPRAADRPRREESIRRFRHKVLAADYFARLPAAVRAECLRHGLLVAEAGRPAAQDAVLASPSFVGLPARDRAWLLYLVGTASLVGDGDACRGRRCLAAAVREHPGRMRYRVALAVARLAPRAFATILHARRRAAARRAPDVSLPPHWTGTPPAARSPGGRGRR